MTGGYVGSLQNAGNTAATAVVKNTWTTAVTLLNPTQFVTLTPNYMYPGKMFRTTVQFGLSNLAAQPTFTFQIMFNAQIGWTSGAILTSTTVNTLLPCELQVTFKVLTVGTTGTILGVGRLVGLPFVTVGAVGNGSYGTAIMVPATTPAAGASVDTTIAEILDFWVACSVSNIGNAMTIYNFDVEDLN